VAEGYCIKARVGTEVVSEPRASIRGMRVRQRVITRNKDYSLVDVADWFAEITNWVVSCN